VSALDTAAEQCAPYGWTLTSEGELVSPKGRHTGVMVGFRKGRYSAGSDAGILWTGPDVAHFLRRFWYAEKVTA
jgi:hypothetical protein